MSSGNSLVSQLMLLLKTPYDLSDTPHNKGGNALQVSVGSSLQAPLNDVSRGGGVSSLPYLGFCMPEKLAKSRSRAEKKKHNIVVKQILINRVFQKQRT